MRQAANHFDADVPVAGSYMRKAAGQIETAADALREGNFSDLVQGAQKFARSQPTAFFGLALLAGFGAVRFLKSASSAPDRTAETSSFCDAPSPVIALLKSKVDVTTIRDERSIAQLFGDNFRTHQTCSKRNRSGACGDRPKS